jgi:hypothetical protein
LTPRLSSLFFLCRCLTLLYDPAPKQMVWTAMSNNKVNWERVVELANVELVTPALWSGLEKAGLQEVLDDEVRSYLSELHSLNCHRNTAIRRQVEEIVRSFNQIGIEPLLLKGAALMFANTHGDPAVRVMTDVDIMVRKDDLPRVVERISTLGYSTMEREVTDNGCSHHYPPMFRAGEPATVELHTRLGDDIDDRMLLTVPEIWRDSIRMSGNGLTCRFMSWSHALFYNVIHSELHHEGFERGRILLRNLLDLAVMCRLHAAEIDWTDIETRIKSPHLGRVLRSYLHMGSRLFGASVPAAIEARTGGRLHFARCLLLIASQRLRFLDGLCISPKRVFRLFAAKRMQERFACGNDIVDLTKTRLTYAVYLVKTYIWGPRRCFLVDLLSGTGIEDASESETNRR